MDKLADALTSTPSSLTLSDGELKKQCTNLLQSYLYKTPASLLAAGPGGNDLLGLLNPGVNTLGYTFILCAKLDTLGLPALDGCWRNVVVLLETYDPRQVRNHCQQEFRRVVEAFATYANNVDKPIAAVRPLQKAILRSESTKFSYMHTQFVTLCLKAKCFRDALPVLDVDIFDFPICSGPDADAFDRQAEVQYQDVLTYFLYGGILYIGVKNWRRSIDFLSYVVAAPGNRCSAIQVEAYKKYILVGLLLSGKLHTIPKSAPTATQRIFKALSKPYEAFANAFVSGDVNIFAQEIALTAEVFGIDNNSGLADQVIKAFRKEQIKALKDTYVTLGVDEIVQKNFDVTGKGIEGSRDTESLILGMIESGEIQASLSHSSPDTAVNHTTVHFDSSNPSGCDPLALETQIKRTVTLTQHVKAMDRKLALSKDYIKWQARQIKAAGGAGLQQMDSDMMDFDYGGEGWDDEQHDLLQELDDDA